MPALIVSDVTAKRRDSRWFDRDRPSPDWRSPLHVAPGKTWNSQFCKYRSNCRLQMRGCGISTCLWIYQCHGALLWLNVLSVAVAVQQQSKKRKIICLAKSWNGFKRTQQSAWPVMGCKRYPKVFSECLLFSLVLCAFTLVLQQSEKPLASIGPQTKSQHTSHFHRVSYSAHFCLCAADNTVDCTNQLGASAALQTVTVISVTEWVKRCL